MPLCPRFLRFQPCGSTSVRPHICTWLIVLDSDWLTGTKWLSRWGVVTNLQAQSGSQGGVLSPTYRDKVALKVGCCHQLTGTKWLSRWGVVTNLQGQSGSQGGVLSPTYRDKVALKVVCCHQLRIMFLSFCLELYKNGIIMTGLNRKQFACV